MAELPHSYFSFNFYIPYVIPPRQEPACSAGISPPVLLRSHSSRLSVIILLLRLLPELRKVRSTSYRVVPPDLSCILMHPPELLCTPIIPRLSVVCIELSGYALSYHGTVPACGHSFGHFSVSQDFTFTVPESSDTALPCS